MTNCEKIKNAVRPYTNQSLTTNEIVSLVLSMYPGTNPTSIIPSDHSGPNPRSGRSYCSCSGGSQVFTRSGKAYLVRGLSELVERRIGAASSRAFAVNRVRPQSRKSIESADVAALVDSLLRLKPSIQPSSDRAWRRALAIRVIDCVLSLYRKYDGFVVPRLDQFERRYPQVRSITDLQDLLTIYPSPSAFMAQCLNYRDDARAITLVKVVNWLVEVAGDGSYETQLAHLETWAANAKPHEHFTLSIPGFAIGGFQYLRMLFGANTTKPDIHIQRYVASSVGHRVSDTQALALLEVAAIEARVSLRDLDTTVWERSARGQHIA